MILTGYVDNVLFDVIIRIEEYESCLYRCVVFIEGKIEYISPFYVTTTETRNDGIEFVNKLRIENEISRSAKKK